MPIFTPDQLRKASIEIFEAAGVPKDEANRVSASLVKANLTNHDSHGIVRIEQYLRDIREGRIRPGAKIDVVKENTSMALIDGNWGFGQLIAEKAMNMAIEKARGSSVSCVGAFHCNHIGRLGEWSMMAAEEDMIGMIFNGYWGRRGIVAPYGGAAGKLVTNPLSVAFPAGEMRPFLVDFATSVVAEGKVRVKRFNREKVPMGWILDREGNPTTDPEDLYQGGVLLPFGGHKGYALCLLIEALCGPLILPLSEQLGNQIGLFVIVINISRFTPLEAFKKRIDARFRDIKATPPAPGFEEVLIPGEPEFDAEEKSFREGIYVSDQIWQSIVEEAKNLGIDIENIT